MNILKIEFVSPTLIWATALCFVAFAWQHHHNRCKNTPSNKDSPKADIVTWGGYAAAGFFVLFVIGMITVNDIPFRNCLAQLAGGAIICGIVQFCKNAWVAHSK